MKYTLTGAAGNITKPLAKKLLERRDHVTVIGRNESHLEELRKAGAHTMTGSVEDVEFLKAAFAGADAVYTMFPPNPGTRDLIGFYETLARNYAEAIRSCGVRHVVNLSSVGAHLSDGTGHISALNKSESVLNSLKQVNIRHLRPVFFYTNLYSFIDMIKGMGMMGSNFTLEENQFPVVHPDDIASVAATELADLSFSGHSVCYIASDETGTDELASTLGKAIGIPDLKWLKFTDRQVKEGLLQAGFPEETAQLFTEGFSALQTSDFWEDYWLKHPSQLGAVKIGDFADEFAHRFSEASALHQ